MTKFFVVKFVKAPTYRKVYLSVIEATDKRQAVIKLRKREGKAKLQILEITQED